MADTCIYLRSISRRVQVFDNNRDTARQPARMHVVNQTYRTYLYQSPSRATGGK